MNFSRPIRYNGQHKLQNSIHKDQFAVNSVINKFPNERFVTFANEHDY